MIEYAGVGLSVPDARVRDHLGEWWHLAHIRETEPDGYLTAGLDHLPRPYPPERRRPRPGVLYWPNGASRWAEFHHLVSQDQLARIRTALGSGNGPATLQISDGEGNSIAPSMYFLAARPVCRAGSDELFLLTLVDVRWYWWLAGDQSVTAAPANWATLFSDLMTKVGGSATADTADSDYATPTARWAVGRQPIPILLDAAAASVGMRVLRTTAGVVKIVNWATAKAAQEVEITAYERHRVTGGRIEAADIARTVPASVASVFHADAGTAETHTSVTLASLSLTEYAGATGVAGRVAQFWADMAASASGSARSNLATQAATDWYKWRLADWEAAYRGVVPWVHAGTEDAVEWEVCYGGAEVPHPKLVTRVLRGHWADPNVYGSGGPVADGEWFWVEITGNNGSAEPNTRYSWKKVILDPSTHLYVDASPAVTGTLTLKRVKSNTPSPTAGALPTIPNTQQVLARASPTDPGFFECPAHGGLQTFDVAVVTAFDSGTCTVTTQTLRVTGRDLVASMV